MAEVVPAPSARRSRRKPLLLILSGVVLALVLAASLWFLRATTPLAPSAQHSTATTDGVSPWVNRRRPELSPRRAPEEATRPAESAAAPAVPRAAPFVAAGQAPERPPLSAVDERTVPQMQGARVAPITPLAPVSPTTPAVPGADAATPGQAGSVVPPARREGSGSAQSTSLAMSGSFRGTTFNETLGRGGGLQLLVTRVGQGEAVAVQFEAFRGLVGTGQLSGRLSNDGRLVATGTLMMGANPFTTELEGTISGKQLVGTVRYTRMVAPGERPSSTQGSFRLARD